MLISFSQPDFSQPDIALLWIIRLAAVGILIDALEWLTIWRELRADGAFGWPWLRSRRVFLQHAPFAFFFDFPGVIGLLLLRGSGALWLLAEPAVGRNVALTLLFFTGLSLHLRNFPYGIDGHHRMMLVIVGALWLQQLAPTSPLVQQATLWFIALQSVLSYVTAGWGKVSAPSWRSGDGLLQALNTPSVGATPVVAHFLAQYRWVATTCNWGVMLIECLFPLVLFSPPPLAFLWLGWGLLFHGMNAVMLGFNKFFWAWTATYPAILYIVYHYG